MSAFFQSPPAALFAPPPVFLPRPTTPLEELPPGSAGCSGAGRLFPRKFNEQQPENVPCTYCGRPTTEEPGTDKLNGDHIIPRSQGGNNEPPNYAPACRTCNLQKGPRTPSEWYEWMRLQTEGDALFDFKRIIKRGGHSTYMLLIKEDEPRFDKYWSALQASGCTYEHGRIKLSIGHRRLFSVDVPPSANLIWVIAILERGQRDDVWMYQEGYRHIP